MEATKKIDATQSLSKVLMAMKQGDAVAVEQQYYTEQRVRTTASRLNRMGRAYSVTSKGMVGEVIVKRLI